MYEKESSLFLKIVEYTNLAIILVFLGLFSYRLYYLRSYALTDRFDNYFPKLRICFCLAYVALSTALLGYNIATDSYSQKMWYEYVLQGGGGQCIDSVILLIQLGVLRLELKKQQPYTRFHIWYFLYLLVMSLARCLLTLLDTLNDLNDVANLAIAALLVTDSAGQLCYWIKNRQSLPEFISHTHEEIDQSRYQSQWLQKRVQLGKRSMHSLMADQFPYITPFLAISSGKVRLTLQRTQRTRGQSQSLIQDDSGLNDSFLEKESARQEVIASSEMSMEEVKRFYTICGRLQLKRQLQFGGDLRSFIRQLQGFLQDLFQEKKSYTAPILRFLQVPPNIISTYQELLEKAYLLESPLLDSATGAELSLDRNAPYLSINLYRFMWVEDHYEYYMRVLKQGGPLSYPIKRIQQIQELHQLLRRMVKTEGKIAQLPALPRTHSFPHRDDELMKEGFQDVQGFLRKLGNEEAVMEDHQLREKVLEFFGYQGQERIVPKFPSEFYQNLKITKGRVTKALIKNDYVTLYEFKLIKNETEVKTIMKRFREIDALHQDVERWMKNRRAPFTLALPEKVLYKTDIRHDKLKNYLQGLLELKEVWSCYAVSVFLEAGLEQQRLSLTSATSQKSRYTLNNSALITDLQPPEGALSCESPPGRTFSKIIDDLGNQDYD